MDSPLTDMSPEMEAQREQTPTDNDDVLLEDSIFNHSNLLHQLLSDSFDDEDTPSLYNKLTQEQTPHTLSSTTNRPSPSILTTSPLVVSSNQLKPPESCTRSSGIVPKPISDDTPTSGSIPKSPSPKSCTCSSSFLPKTLPETRIHSTGLIPKHQPPVTHTHSTGLIPKHPIDTCSSFIPKSDITSQSSIVHTKVNHTTSSSHHTPELIESTTNVPSCIAHYISNSDDSDEDDVAFWSHVVSTIDANGMDNVVEDDTDEFLINLDKESLNQLFQFDEPPKQGN